MSGRQVALPRSGSRFHLRPNSMKKNLTRIWQKHYFLVINPNSLEA
jgi:hypothetical protein